MNKAYPPSSLVDKEYLEEFTRLLNEDHPDHNLTPQKIFDMALELLHVVQLVAKPIPKEKEAEYLKVLELVKKENRPGKVNYQDGYGERHWSIVT